MNSPRRAVLWFGAPPAAAAVQEFKNRGLHIVETTADSLTAANLVSARGAVYNFTARDIGIVRICAEATIERAIDHGLLSFFLAESDTVQGYLDGVLTRLPAEPRPTRKTAPAADHELAEAFARHDAGLPYSSALKIEPEEVASQLGPDDVLLFRRAFADCTTIRLKSLNPGRTASVFMVHATFKDSLAGPRPLPFFAKVGPRRKIDEEISKYRTYATHFVPFYLRPNLAPARCVLGHKQGLLIGDFVDRSESLWALAQRGQANGVIHALFDVTLNGWRAQAYVEGVAPAIGPVAEKLKTLFDYERVQADYLVQARQFGVTATPQELWEFLIGLTDQCYRISPMHGDLHGENVRVRGTDAILIDLASIAEGPLAADPASLETSLFFDMPENSEDMPGDEAWRQAADAFYAPNAFRRLPEPASENQPLAWMWNTARQVRMLALPTQACDTEYASAVAVYLLRRSMYAPASPRDHVRRAHAYVVAARIINNLRSESVTA